MRVEFFGLRPQIVGKLISIVPRQHGINFLCGILCTLAESSGTVHAGLGLSTSCQIRRQSVSRIRGGWHFVASYFPEYAWINVDSTARLQVGNTYLGRHRPRFLGSRFRCRVVLSLVVVSVHLRSIVILVRTLVGRLVALANPFEAIIKSIRVCRFVLRSSLRRREGALEIPPRLTRLRNPL